MDFVARRPDVIRSIQQRWLLKYWSSLCAGPTLPTWPQVDIQEIARAIDRVVVFDVVRNGAGPRFRIRFQGARITEAYGADCSGKYLDQTQPPSTREGTLAIYRRAVEIGRPLYTIAETRDGGGCPVAHERLMLPFGRGGAEVARIVTALETVSVEGRFQQQELLSSSPGLSYGLLAVLDVAPEAPATVLQSNA